MEYARLRGEAGSDVSLMDLGFQTDFRVYLHLRQTWKAFSESQPPSPAPSEAWEGVGGPSSSQMQPLSAPYSDNSEHPGGNYHLTAHLPTEENSHCHCTHQRGQQVGARVPGGPAGVVQGCSGPDACVSAPPQGRGICHVLPAVPAGHFLPVVPLHRLLG